MALFRRWHSFFWGVLEDCPPDTHKKNWFWGGVPKIFGLSLGRTPELQQQLPTWPPSGWSLSIIVKKISLSAVPGHNEKKNHRTSLEDRPWAGWWPAKGRTGARSGRNQQIKRGKITLFDGLSGSECPGSLFSQVLSKRREKISLLDRSVPPTNTHK